MTSLWTDFQRYPALLKTMLLLDAAGMSVVLSISTMNLIVIQTFIVLSGAVFGLSPFVWYYWWSWERAGRNVPV